MSAEVFQAREPSRGGEPLLQLQELGVSFATPDGEVAAVRDFSLEVARGECVGIVGESGAGKSQVFLAIMGLLAANARVQGRAHFAGVGLIGQPAAQLDRIRGARIGMIFQDPMTSLTPHQTIGAHLAEPLVRHRGLSGARARLEALTLLKRVQVTDAARRLKQYPHELSGGMRQRVMIAIALACEPELLIADEPTTALDVTIQAQILALLAQLKRERGMSLVLITHDLGVVAGIADRVAVMKQGRIVELDSAATVLTTPRHPYTQSLLRALPRIDDPPAVAKAGDVTLDVSRLNVHYSVRDGWFGSPEVLRAVNDVSLQLRSGQALGVVGESGSGKSTLARAVLQLLRPVSGSVVWLGKPLQTLTDRQLRGLRRDLQIVFQDPLASLDPRMTIAEIVEEPLRVHRPELDRASRRDAALAMLRRVGLDPAQARRYPHEFSGGQCQRVGIARAMILRPRLLVCDEPVSALDVSIQGQVLDLLAGLKHEFGLSILFVSHNLAVVRRLCEQVLVLYLGRMMELGASERLFARPLHPYTRDLLAAVPVADPQLQPARLAHPFLGEAPSPLNPPRGCVYQTRCPLAVEACRRELPAWEEPESGSGVACHRWRELSSLPATTS